MGKYSDELKQDALYMAITEGFSKAQRKYQVPQSTLRLWHKTAKDSGRLPDGYADKAPELKEGSEAQASATLETEMDECCDETPEQDKPDAIATAMAQPAALEPYAPIVENTENPGMRPIALKMVAISSEPKRPSAIAPNASIP
jgi:transposase-like protein